MGSVTLGHFLVDFYMNLIPAILPFLAIQQKLSLTSLGMMVTVTNLTVSVVQPLFGYVVDRRGTGWMLALSLAWTSILMSLIGFVSGYYSIMLLATLAGFGASFYHPLGSSFMNKLAEKKKGAAMSIFVTGGSLGFALTPLVVVPQIEQFGLSSLGYLAIPGLVGILPLVLAGLNRLKSFKPRHEIAQQYSGLDANKWLVVLNIIVILRAWVQAVIMTFVPLLFIQRGNSFVAGGQLLTVFLVAGTIGVLVGGYISDLVSRKMFMLFDFIVTILVLILFMNTSGALSWFLLGCAGALLQAPIPVTVVMAQELIPRNAGVAAGMIMGMGVGLGTGGAFVSGVIGDHFGIEWAVKSVIVLLVIGTILIAAYPTDRKNQKNLNQAI